MDSILLILRPQPGADATASRAAEIGLDAVVAPLFTVRPVAWDAPSSDEVDALLLTSANAARLAGDQIRYFLHRPCYAVGEASAGAARSAGFQDVRTGPSDGAAILDLAASDGIGSLLHLCGREHLVLEHPSLSTMRRIVYAAEAVDALPVSAAKAMHAGTTALIHSPRAAAVFAMLADQAELDRTRIRIAAISDAAAAAAGLGWASVSVAARPRDEALLELAAKLCKTGGSDTGNGA